MIDEREDISTERLSVSSTPELAKGEKIKEGGRDIYLFRQVSGLVNNFSKEEVLRRALIINDEKFTEPLKEKEILRIVDWAWKKYGRPKSDDLGLKQ